MPMGVYLMLGGLVAIVTVIGILDEIGRRKNRN